MTADAARQPLRSLFELEDRLGCHWTSIHSVSEKTAGTIENLRKVLDTPFDSEDYSIVVFGSLARYEFTPHSDLDWTLLIDGIAADDHWDVFCRVREAVQRAKFKDPGREGTFENFAFAHELLHQIGGPDDTNKNTTRRILLLLESLPFGRRDAYDRVIRGVLRRYLSEDEAFRKWRAAQPVPRFLLNDFARFWWTMAVDFAYKRRSRQGDGAVLRNLKLRMSRKLIYAAGLLTCFSLALDESSARQLKDEKFGIENRIEYFKDRLARPPLEILAAHLVNHQHLNDAAKKIFNAYDRFLGALANETDRKVLEDMSEEDRGESDLYRTVRQATHEFRDAILEVFFDDQSGLGNLTKSYGVF